METKYYLVSVWGGVEASLYEGPFDDYDALLIAARELAEENSHEYDSMFYLKMVGSEPEIGNFSEQEIHPDEEVSP